jgi:phosphoglycolate phosphatase
MDSKSRPRRFDLIAFDWDGTLFDSTGLIVRCIQAACRDIGAAVPDDMQAAYVIGLGLMDALKHAVPDLPVERYPELGRRYRHHYIAWQHEVVLFAGTREMLRSLQARNHWLAVATGKSRRGLDEALDSAGLDAFFDTTRTADETASKPDPLMLREMMAELGAEPARTLMVGDTTHDLQLAANAGVACVAVSYGAHAPENFERFQPLFVAHSTRELHDWLLHHA